MRSDRKTRVAVIGTVGIPAKYGGFETLTEHLAGELGDKLDFSVYCSGRKYARAERMPVYRNARLIYLPLSANGIQSVLYDCISILHALFYADVLLVLGVSGGMLLPFVRLFTRKRIIVSIDGIEWKRSKWSKTARWYLWAAEWFAVKFSHADIADNESIQDYTALRYKTRSSIIEYGADHTMAVTLKAADQERFPFLAQPYAFKVCRIEPENNIHLVLDAFSGLPDQTLVIMGNWDNSKYGIDLKEQYRDCTNLVLLDPIYDQQLLDLIRSNCSLYVHGHSAGGTNPSLVEAMHLGLPVAAFSVMYNRTTTDHKALYFRTASDLADIVRNQDKKSLEALGSVMQSIAGKRYTWKIIAGNYGYLINKVMKKPAVEKPLAASIQKLAFTRLIQNEIGHLHATAHFYEKR